MAHPYWLCPTCGDAATSRQKALDCCEFEPTQKWLCEVCRAGYETKADAERCETEDQKAAHSGEGGEMAETIKARAINGTTSISTETLATMKIRRFKFETVDTVTKRIAQWYAIRVTAPIELKGALVRINGEYKWISVSDRDNAWKAAKQAKGER